MFHLICFGMNQDDREVAAFKAVLVGDSAVGGKENAVACCLRS
jgi:hypothetical protein